MPITNQEAAEALAGVERAARRASIIRGYEYGAPHFLLWGCIWLIGYGISGLRPDIALPVWLVLDAVGIGGSYWIGRATAAGAPSTALYGWRFGACAATFIALIVSIEYVLRPHEIAQFGALPALVGAAAYVLMGNFRGPRWIVVGVVLGVLTLVGFVELHAHYMLWMALAGGGTLIGTGLWLRRA